MTYMIVQFTVSPLSLSFLTISFCKYDSIFTFYNHRRESIVKIYLKDSSLELSYSRQNVSS